MRLFIAVLGLSLFSSFALAADKVRCDVVNYEEFSTSVSVDQKDPQVVELSQDGNIGKIQLDTGASSEITLQKVEGGDLLIFLETAGGTIISASGQGEVQLYARKVLTRSDTVIDRVNLICSLMD